ncbi:hypothetical protein ABMY20_15460 [Tenacibaculum sp. SSH1-16]|uniref:hypothetical protein n=1 Tax=Tenacibaculum sp. SSH1-16 TaxID=3136667 RepID=UPI0032C3E130
MRFIIEKVYPIAGSEEFYYKEKEIREWGLSPDLIYEVLKLGSSIPTSRAISVVYPEIENLPEYSDIISFRYAIDVPNDFLGVFTVESKDQDFNNLTLSNQGVHLFKIKYNNFSDLNYGTNKWRFKHIIYGTDSNGVERELESRTQELRIIKLESTNDKYLLPNKGLYYLEYDLDSKKLLGDTLISIDRSVVVNPHQTSVKLTIPAYYEDKIILKKSTPQVGFDDAFAISMNQNFNFSKGSHVFWGKIEWSQFDWVKVGSNWLYEESKTTEQVSIILEIIDKSDNFKISKNWFNGLLKLHEDLKFKEVMEITNYDNAALTITSSDWITTSLNNNSLSFETLKASQLKIGKNYGYIKIQSSNITRVCTIVIEVKETITTNFNDVNFCLDNHLIDYQKQSNGEFFLRMILSMEFSGYGKPKEIINQVYEYAFFNDRVSIYPGEEIQDFFNEIESLELLNINNTTATIPTSKELFTACKASITLEEYNTSGDVSVSSVINNLYFLPGKKPKAFPYLTNGTVRKTYSNSLISINAIKSIFEVKRLGEIAGNLIDNSNLSNDKSVVNICFKRFVADKTYGEINIIEKENLSLNPIPETQTVIDVIFQNQNMCPDWFSFTGEWQQHPELNHIISENIRNGREFKSSVEQKNTIKLNTGWMFEEEVELLTELMESTICFAFLKGEWVKLIPITKKPLPYFSQRTLNSQIVEFKKVNNER